LPQFNETIAIKRPPEQVWEMLGHPERWFDGYLESSDRSDDYPAAGSHDDRLYKTRMKERVAAQITRSETASVLEEDQDGKTFHRHVRYSLQPDMGGTFVRVEDEVDFKGLGKLAAPIASRDIQQRWSSSLRKLKSEVEASQGNA
jgi:carbon monoxide dehydrogenase subunit G